MTTGGAVALGSTKYACIVYAALTGKYVDVDDGECVRVHVHDDVHSEQSHSKLRPQLLHHGDHHVIIWGGDSRHRLIQLGGNRIPLISSANDIKFNNYI